MTKKLNDDDLSPIAGGGDMQVEPDTGNSGNPGLSIQYPPVRGGGRQLPDTPSNDGIGGDDSLKDPFKG